MEDVVLEWVENKTPSYDCTRCVFPHYPESMCKKRTCYTALSLNIDCPDGYYLQNKQQWVKATADNVKVGSTVRCMDQTYERTVHVVVGDEVCLDRVDGCGITTTEIKYLEVLL